MSAPIADFGPLVVTTDIDDAVIATLRKWLPTFLSRVELERGKTEGSLPRPDGSQFLTALEEDPGEMLDRKLPAIVVTTARTDQEPSLAADGSYLATWRTTISCIVRGRRASETKATAALFEGSVRRLLVSDKGCSFGGAVHASKWLSAMVGPVPNRASTSRYLAAGISEWRVWTQNTVQAVVGPAVPDSDSYDPLPDVGSFDIALTADPVGGQL